MAANDEYRKNVRDIILTHAHLDHTAGLPLFVDDLFAQLDDTIRIHALKEVIEILKEHVFNWSVYPCFSELENDNGAVLSYSNFLPEKEFSVAHLSFKAIEVNHKVPAVGFVISDGNSRIAISGDTAEMGKFWDVVNKEPKLDALFIECAFPNKLAEIAKASHHMTPNLLTDDLKKFGHQNCPIYIVNIKPMYRDEVIQELQQMQNPAINVLEIGKEYNF